MFAKPESIRDLFQSILNSIPIGIYVIDRELNIYWTNKRLIRWIKGRKVPSEEDNKCFTTFFGRKSPCDDCPAIKAFETGTSEYAEMSRVFQEKPAHYLTTSTPLEEETVRDGSLVIVTIQDITEHKMAEEELRRLNDFNREIIENAPVAIFTVNREGEFSSVNPALAVLSGLGERAGAKLLGFNWLNNPYTIKCGLAQHIREGLEGKPFQLWDFPFINYWGAPQYIYFKGVPLRDKEGNVEDLLCIIEETTEIVRTRAQLLQEAKMSVVGRLAAGLAHELNNPLATITANSELAKEIIENAEREGISASDLVELKEYIDTIEEQAYRCTKTIKNLLGVTRKKEFGTSAIDFKEFLSELLVLINFRKMGIKLIKKIPAGLPQIVADPEALRQVFLNVINNAVDALEGTENATVWIKAMTRDTEKLEITIEDNGIGIPEDMAELIFEPFFTTKGPKKGTGLGLTLCYDFLKRMGGNIEVQNRQGGGTIFVITVPLTGERAE